MSEKPWGKERSAPPTEESVPPLGPLLEWAPVAVAIVDASGTIRSVNRRLEALFGYERSVLPGRSVDVLVPERLRSSHERMRQRFNAAPEDRSMGSGRDLVGLRQDGSEFPIEAGLSVVPWRDERLTVATVIDVTKRKQTADQLEQRVRERTRELERRRRVADGLRDVLATLNSDLDFQEVLRSIVRQAAMLLGAETVAIYRRDPAYAGWSLVAGRHPGTAAPQVSPPIENGPCLQAVQAALREGRAQRVADGGAACDHRSLLAVPLIIRSEPYGGLLLAFDPAHPPDDEEERLAETVADQAALAIENDRTRRRARRAAVAAERSRIARDLHDSVSQTLFSANLISDVLPRVWARDPEAGSARLGELQQLTRGALAEMRSLLLELRPDVLRDVPLPELLQQLADAFEGRARIPLALSIQIEEPVPPDVRIALYRTAQEALNNVVRHAHANRATMQLWQQEGTLWLVVEDDGQGFTQDTAPTGHLGLRTMRERTQAVGAQLEVTSRPGEGTRVAVAWPASPVLIYDGHMHTAESLPPGTGEPPHTTTEG